MTRSVEIPEEAIGAFSDAYLLEVLSRVSTASLPSSSAVRAGLLAALPYLAPACQGDGVCTNPRCPTHGIEWDVPAVPVDREALSKAVYEKSTAVVLEGGYITTLIAPEDAVSAVLAVLAGEQEQVQ